MQDCVNQRVNQYYQKWYRHCVGLTRGDHVKAGDLLHEVLARILDRDSEQLTALACRDTFYYYVNRALWLSWYGKGGDYHSKFRKFEQMCVDHDFDHNRPDETFIGSRLDNEYIDGYLMRLNEHDAILLRLYSLPDFNYDQLAADTGLDKKYLTAAVYLALRRIRKIIKKKQNADQF